MTPLTSRIELDIDPGRLRESVASLLERHPLVYEGTRQLALQHRPGATDPWHEGCLRQSLISADSDFTEVHPELRDGYLGEVFDRLPFRPVRTRIMALDPRYCYSVHRDQTPRYHLAVTTSEHARFVFVEHDKVLNIPADGNLYYVDTRHLHSAFNGGDEMRVHLVFGTDPEQE
ncbi:aspartyl/asparaginyl beta-hydroxylase domain-containing protein [Streptosporangium sp. NPDC051022]|uniref:aspartyl/asparaginyl beta-hydroxylase domain-containing protein n=1 Tax=Streptosporangium sp. NPDC051022 TaxID=3155752 RepID=UPI00342D960E